MSRRAVRRLLESIPDTEIDRVGTSPDSTDSKGHLSAGCELTTRSQNPFGLLVEHAEMDEDAEELVHRAAPRFYSDKQAATRAASKRRQQQTKPGRASIGTRSPTLPAAAFEELLHELSSVRTDETAGQQCSSAERCQQCIADRPLADRWLAETSAGFELFAVDSSKLNADNELVRFFGRDVVEREQIHQGRGIGSPSGRSGGRRHARYRHRSQGSAETRSGSTGSSSRSFLVNPSSSWPRTMPGLSMEPVSTWKAPRPVFRYRYREPYESLDEGYEQVVQSGDHNLLIEFSLMYPFHVGALLQLAEIYRVFGETERETECIERALFVLETSQHRRYRPGIAYLPFSMGENQRYYRALCLGAERARRKGAYRTAMEISKLLCTLDPPNDEAGTHLRQWSDPVGALLVIDAYALLAKAWSWIRRCMESEHPAAVVLRQLPNWQYSHLYALSMECSTLVTGDKVDLDQPMAATVNKRLEECVQRFPYLAQALVTGSSSSVQSLSSLVLRRVIAGYVTRTAALWRNSPLAASLRRCLAEQRLEYPREDDHLQAQLVSFECLGVSMDAQHTEWIQANSGPNTNPSTWTEVTTSWNEIEPSSRSRTDQVMDADSSSSSSSEGAIEAIVRGNASQSQTDASFA